MVENIHTDNLESIALKGEIYTASIAISDMELINLGSDQDFIKHLKIRLAKMIVDKFLENSRCVLYTKSQDYLNSTTKYIARMVLLPNEDVQLVTKEVANRESRRR